MMEEKEDAKGLAENAGQEDAIIENTEGSVASVSEDGDASTDACSGQVNNADSQEDAVLSEDESGIEHKPSETGEENPTVDEEAGEENLPADAE